MLPPEKIRNSKPWQESPVHLYQLFGSRENGLENRQVEERVAVYGHNVIVHKEKRPVVLEFLGKFLDPLILILLFASLISGLLGQTTNFIIIIVMITMSVVLDFYQEHEAKEAASKLRARVSLTATVLRHGENLEIKAADLVPGDIILLSAGDIVPADARLIDSRDLLVNQGTLTGESFPVEKTTTLIKEEKPAITEITNMVFMGTSIVSGQATALVTATGKMSQVGQIATDLGAKQPATEFEIGVHRFGFLLMRLTFVLVISVFFINAFLRHEVLDSFLFALALAVGMTPELLPIVVSVNLARGALRMSHKGVIVKNLHAIESFGGMEVLATDKTGTLTLDKIHLEKYEDVYGQENQHTLLFGFLNAHFQSRIKGPMEEAILAHREVSSAGYKKVDEVAFDFVRKRLSTILQKEKKLTLIAKGAPEGIFANTTHYYHAGQTRPFSESISERVIARFQELSRRGYRVLAVASKEVGRKERYHVEDERNLTLLGLMAFLDPAKPDADDAVAILKSRGVEMKILTGDNELVTAKICADINLPVKGIVVGRSLEALNSDELFRIATNNTIFARLNPNQKERIILVLKQRGVCVGYLGDGINDASSLAAADIGISVDNAVDVAKEAADLILLRKDLHVLKDGIIEGRKTFANVMKYIMMGTSSNFGNMASVAIASIFLPFLPMLPVQILLNNFLYDVSQIFLSADEVDAESIRAPVRWNLDFIKKFMLIFGPVSSLFDFLTFGILLFVFKASVPLFQTGWFVESLVTQTFIIFSIRTRVMPFYKSKPGLPLLISSLVILITALLLPLVSQFAKIFGFVRLPLNFYLILGIMLLAYFNLVEKMKCWFYAKYRVSASAS